MHPVDQAIIRLEDLGAQKLMHINGDLAQHLKGTYDLLKSWGNKEDICLAGLYHSIYSTAGFSESLVTVNHRKEIAKIIGDEAEELVYIFCACDRNYTYQQFLQEKTPSYKDRYTGEIFILSASVLSSFCELTFANELEIAAHNKEFDNEPLIKLFDKMSPYVSTNAVRYYKKYKRSNKFFNRRVGKVFSQLLGKMRAHQNIK